MNETTVKMRAFAQRLIAYERKRNKSSEANGSAFSSTCETLRGPLVALTGTAGFRSLLSRALALANGEVRWLRGCHVKADGSLELPAEMFQLDMEEVAQGEIVLVAQLLGLLVTFIGEPLALRVVQDVWPEAPIDDWNQ